MLTYISPIRVCHIVARTDRSRRRSSDTLRSLLFMAAVPMLALLLTAAESQAASPQEQDRFFETHIRPILVEKCQECHGSKKQWAELRLDSRAAMLQGGESGPAIIPAKPAESRLIEVIQYSENDSQMPPAGKLSDEQIARLTEWVSMGAPWPESAADAAVEKNYFEQAKTHWAYQPVQKPDVPATPESYRRANAIDHFVAVKLAEQQLPQSPRAEPQLALRRLAFDLTGLPVPFAEAQKFYENPTDAAWAESVERLLASPDFGVKWARHWLDIARYADTRGYVFTEERRYPFAYTYRDYVIQAFNEDLPYDQFLREQLAADLIPEKRNEATLAALGFLTVGQRFLNRTQDIYDDRIDVTTRGLMGVTLACARCHDHKFDPLEAADYYALYGVFDSTYEPEQLPQIGESTDQKAFAEYQAELAKREQKLQELEAELVTKINAELAEHVENYLIAAVQKSNHQVGKYQPEGKYEIRKRVDDNWLKFLRAVSTDDPVFGPWRRTIGLNDEQFAKDGSDRIARFVTEHTSGKAEYQPLVVAALQKQPPAHLYDLAKIYGELYRQSREIPADATAEDRAAWEQLAKRFQAEDVPLKITTADLAAAVHRDERNNQRNLAKKIDELMVTSEGAPPRAMVLYDKENPASPVIFKRGNPGLRGDKVDRRFLKVLDFVRAEPFSPKASGRLELADAITSRDNPLTARVLVNRVWMLLIGRPLVENTDDFGLRTPLPTHPELLDHLAWEFMEHNWSIKWLVREIVTSETYRQTSLASAPGNAIDLENQLVWRMNRKRLPFESMRDAMLLSAGQLDREMFGRPQQLEGKKPSARRTIFGFVDRNNVSNLLRNFDVAGPFASVSQRAETTVPQQALYGLNSPFVMDLAQKIVAQLEPGQPAPASVDKVVPIFQQVLQREPRGDEVAMCEEFLSASEYSPQAWQELTQALLLTNEFLFLD